MLSPGGVSGTHPSMVPALDSRRIVQVDMRGLMRVRTIGIVRVRILAVIRPRAACGLVVDEGVGALCAPPRAEPDVCGWLGFSPVFVW